MSQREFDVVVAGDLFIDLILSGFAEWPSPGTEAFAHDFQREVGGGAAITACGLARLGSRAAVLSVVGRDHGAWVAERLAGFGVITSELKFDDDKPTGFAVAISTAEERTFFTYQGANARFAAILAEAAMSGELSRARHIHLGWAPPLDTGAELFSALRANGCTISLDVGWHEAWLMDARAAKLLRMADIFFPNELEASKMTGISDPERSLRWFEAAGVARVVLKLGAQGAAMLWDGELFRVPSLPVLPIDTIGAGDCFDAGFLHYWLHGAAPLDCLRAANFCGATSTEERGGLAGFPASTRVAEALRL